MEIRLRMIWFIFDFGKIEWNWARARADRRSPNRESLGEKFYTIPERIDLTAITALADSFGWQNKSGSRCIKIQMFPSEVTHRSLTHSRNGEAREKHTATTWHMPTTDIITNAGSGAMEWHCIAAVDKARYWIKLPVKLKVAVDAYQYSRIDHFTEKIIRNYVHCNRVNDSRPLRFAMCGCVVCRATVRNCD